MVTPVYNGETYLAECIESVLGDKRIRTSSASSSTIAAKIVRWISLWPARKGDCRVRVHNNEKFVGVIENHNIAFSLISPAAKYCKVVSADDIIFPECIRRLVEVGEMHPCVGGHYWLIPAEREIHQVAGISRTQGRFTPGRDVCRCTFPRWQPGIRIRHLRLRCSTGLMESGRREGFIPMRRRRRIRARASNI